MNIGKKIKTLDEFVALVQSICSEWEALNTTTHPWFRGQSNSAWNLIPSLYRGRIDSYYERELLRDFILRSKLYVDHCPNNDLEWIFLMQHYGMPTRLLDWTESHMFALYFAVSSGDSATDGAVWVLDPWPLNFHSIGMESVPTADHPLLGTYALQSGSDRLGREIEATIPVAVRPPRNNARINAQRGTFTIHGSSTEGLDTWVNTVQKRNDKSTLPLRRIIVERSRKEYLRRQLYLAGVTEAVLFPDLTGLCSELSYRYSQDYMKAKDYAKKPTTARAPIKMGMRPIGSRPASSKPMGSPMGRRPIGSGPPVSARAIPRSPSKRGGK